MYSLEATKTSLHYLAFRILEEEKKHTEHTESP